MEIKFVKKASGHIQKFSVKKLERSIMAALKHAGVKSEKSAEHLAHEVVERLEGEGKKVVESDAIRTATMHVLEHNKLRNALEVYESISLKLKQTTLKAVIKRGGSHEPFHPHKLFKAIKKSFVDAGQENILEAERITKEVVEVLEKSFGDKPVPIEEIRKTTAKLLREQGFAKVEKSYLLHKYL